MEYIINLTVGSIEDSNSTENFSIQSSLPEKDIEKFYSIGRRKLRFDIQAQCRYFQKNSLTEQQLKTLKKKGIENYFKPKQPVLSDSILSDWAIGSTELQKFFDTGEMTSSIYVVVWLFIASLGDDKDFPAWRWRPYIDRKPSIHLGGYGVIQF